MSLLSRFFGKQPSGGGSESAHLTANPEIEHPLSLQVLFSASSRLDPGAVIEALKSCHPSMSAARCELDPELDHQGNTLGLLGWEKHVVRCVGFDLPMPEQAVEACVAPSHYSASLKQQARAHQSHLLLYYAGYETSPHEQYVALAATAAVLGNLGAVAVLNEAARTSLPTAMLTGLIAKQDALAQLRALPLPLLYCGFVKHEVQGIEGVWMRTYGASLLGLPDLAAHAQGHHEGQRYFEIFNAVLDYLRKSGAHVAPGHTMQVGDRQFLRLRAPLQDEKFLESSAELLVAEIIGADQINRPQRS